MVVLHERTTSSVEVKALDYLQSKLSHEVRWLYIETLGSYHWVIISPLCLQLPNCGQSSGN